jgi:hypothetical protein
VVADGGCESARRYYINENDTRDIGYVTPEYENAAASSRLPYILICGKRSSTVGKLRELSIILMRSFAHCPAAVQLSWEKATAAGLPSRARFSFLKRTESWMSPDVALPKYIA